MDTWLAWRREAADRIEKFFIQSLLRLALPVGRGGWHDDGVDYLLAQVNIARMLAPLDSDQLAEITVMQTDRQSARYLTL